MCVVTLTACGKLPRPFERDVAAGESRLARTLFFDGVSVDLVTGSTLPMGKLLAESVIAGLERYHVPAAIKGLQNSRFALSGRAIVPRAGQSVPEPPVRIRWTLRERQSGTIVDEFEEIVPGNRQDWDYGSSKIFDQVRTRTGAKVAKLVLGDRMVEDVENVYPVKAGIWLGDVEGAPGDGNAALKRAMVVALAGQSLSVTREKDNAAFILTGSVDVGDADDGEQPVNIVWTVFSAYEVELGVARQANAVPEGSLDGQWGRTAAFVAAAAVPGIHAVLVEKGGINAGRAPTLGGGL